MTRESGRSAFAPPFSVVDEDGDDFPSASIFFLVRAHDQTKLKIDQSTKWIVQYRGNDRTKVALKSASNGLYLAPAGAVNNAVALIEQREWWTARPGSQARTFSLASSYTPRQSTSLLLRSDGDPYLMSVDVEKLDHEPRKADALMFRNTPEYLAWKEFAGPRPRTDVGADRGDESQWICCNSCGKRCGGYEQALKDSADEQRHKLDHLQSRTEALEAWEAKLQQWEEDLASRANAVPSPSTETQFSMGQEVQSRPGPRPDLEPGTEQTSDAGPKPDDEPKLGDEPKPDDGPKPDAEQEPDNEPKPDAEQNSSPQRKSSEQKTQMHYAGQSKPPPIKRPLKKQPPDKLPYTPALLERFEAGRAAMKSNETLPDAC